MSGHRVSWEGSGDTQNGTSRRVFQPVNGARGWKGKIEKKEKDSARILELSPLGNRKPLRVLESGQQHSSKMVRVWESGQQQTSKMLKIS